jgi:hypothetical protein
MKTLAEHIDQQLLAAANKWGHCAVYEKELQRLWPINMDNRKAAIDQFAMEYGFQLIYYRSGICAIFEKESPRSW